MSITNTTSLVPISTIVIQREARQRAKVETEDLERSIKRIGKGEKNTGLINPIVVSREDMVLKTGERRLTACERLGHDLILVRWAEDLTPAEAQIIELEENIKRSDLDWPDLVRGVARIHALFLSIDPEWTMTETAEECSLSQGTVSVYLRVHAELSQPRIAEASTVREAYNVLARKDQRAQGDALEELIGGSASTGLGELTGSSFTGFVEGKSLVSGQPTGTTVHWQKPALFSGVLNESFLDWLPKYSGPRFNLVHCDFPYGVDLFDGPQGRGTEPSAGYRDSKEIYFTLLEALCKNLDRVMSLSGHLMFWYSGKHHDATMQMFRQLAPSLAFSTFPLIWMKSDNAGIASDPTHGPRHVYETCLFASRSKRQIVRVVSDAYSAPTDKRLHPSTKPEPMLRHFMSMLVDETTSLLDPTCGSGASLRAAESLGAKHTLGLEIDKDFADAAEKALTSARILRGANRAGGKGPS